MKEWERVYLAVATGVLTILQILLAFYLHNPAGLQFLRYLGGIIWILAWIFGILPVTILGRKHAVMKGKTDAETAVILDSGIYAIVRQPRYLAVILLALGMVLITQHWLIAIIGATVTVLIYIGTTGADQYGLQKFGDEYKCYMEVVPRMNVFVGLIRLLQRKKRG